VEGVLFSGPGFRALEVSAENVTAVQRFFEENPEYFLAVAGEAPRAGQAQEEFEDRPPAGWPWDEHWMIRLVDSGGAIVALADVVSNLLAPGVWHIGLFIVATRLHGRGEARAYYDALEKWVRLGGAQWLRLNVAVGNGRAERFWEKAGFTEVRRREGVAVGRRVNTMRVLVKPLADGGVDRYLERVPRDRPESP
jgi:ribosomal protein S18 acetylase RimI-like enzyme